MSVLGTLSLLLALQSPDPRFLYVKYQLTEKFGFSWQEVDSLFKDPRLRLYPPDAFPKRRIDWEEFKREILRPSSVRAGRTFITEHREVFEAAEARFGVESEYIASLLRVETHFGKNLGDFRVINVFYTRLLDKDSRRWKWAADNLIALSVYCLVYELDCYGIYGSHAGASGLPQFLPTTLVEHGVDADLDRMENVFSLRDAVFSAANYLVSLGWHKNKELVLAGYYGQSRGYPEAVERYALAVGRIE